MLYAHVWLWVMEFERQKYGSLSNYVAKYKMPNIEFTGKRQHQYCSFSSYNLDVCLDMRIAKCVYNTLNHSNKISLFIACNVQLCALRREEIEKWRHQYQIITSL